MASNKHADSHSGTDLIPNHFYPEFYAFYRSQHREFGTRVLHFIGTGLFICWCAFCFLTRRPPYHLLLGPVLAYGCAWISHFFVECNKPATFRAPLYSLAGDFLMFWRLLTAQEAFRVS